MSKKKRTPVAEARMRAIDDPTAAFPIGALAGMVERLQSAEDDEDLEEVEPDEMLDDDEPLSDEGWSAPGGISAAFLVLSLLGGMLLAIGILGFVGVFLVLQA